MNIILLSGGSGKRLWPLSNEVRSKQFIKIFRRPGAEDTAPDAYESMVQRVYRQILSVDPDAAVTIATSKSANRRHQLINIGTDGLYFAFTESVL